MWNREDLAWLAGLVEGEGNVRVQTQPGSRMVALRLSVKMTDLDVLQRAQEVAGLGRVFGPYPRSNPNWKSLWDWHVFRSREAYALAVALWPWLGSRRKEQVRSSVNAWIAGQRSRPSPEERFWALVDRSGECWVWRAAKVKRGPRRAYGQFALAHTKTVLAHRFAFMLLHGPLPKYKNLRKTCATELCVRHWKLHGRS